MDLDRLVEGLTEFGKHKIVTLAYLKGYVPKERVDLCQIARIALQGYEFTPGDWCRSNLQVSLKKGQLKRKVSDRYYNRSYESLEGEGDFEAAYLKAIEERDPWKQTFYGNLNSFVRGCYIAITSQPIKYPKIPGKE
ncbi:MAG: hypothetical protein WCV90_08130 [Candidatus Woesearchaeota archaeon]|jgi:hypothetical protein